MAIAISLHLLAALIWVGGMFFAYMALRPAASSLLEPPLRLALWVQVFRRFFPWVGLSIAILFISGFWMISSFFEGMKNVGPHVHAMATLGFVMALMFLHIYFAPFRRLKQAVIAKDWEQGAKKLNQIRILMALNLVLGFVVVVIGVAGRYLG